jgi:hypothetical protein
MKHIVTLAIAGLFVVTVALAIIFPTTAISAISMMRRALIRLGSMLFLFPFALYTGFGMYVQSRGRLVEILRDEVQRELEKQQMASLTLAGFCFTSLGLLISFLKDEIKAGEPGPRAILMFFAVALGSFIFSHMVLRYRGRRIFSLISDASVDNGLWCILVGLWSFSTQTAGLGGLATVFAFVILGYLVYLGLNFYYYVRLLR